MEPQQSTPQTSTEPVPQQQTDGRKKPRTEAQIASTKRMLKAREEKRTSEPSLSLNAPATPSSLAMAEVWYSNHETAKEKRRAKKLEDMEALISKRLDAYHEKILGEIQKPVAGFLDHYLTENWDFDEEKVAEQPAEKPVETAIPKLKRGRQQLSADRNDSTQPSDFSKFF
jgi:hypothetical protein